MPSIPPPRIVPLLTYAMAAAPTNLEDMFKAFSKFGDTRSDGTHITLTQADKWMKQASVIDGKKITTTDTGICFNKFKSKSIQYGDFVKFVDDLANYKKMDSQQLKTKLTSCGSPGVPNTTHAVAVSFILVWYCLPCKEIPTKCSKMSISLTSWRLIRGKTFSKELR